MLRRIILAVIIGVAVTLGCMLAGTLLGAVNITLATTVGDFLLKYATAFGILAALYSFFAGGTV